jgi:hypothetical protein
LLQRLLLPYYYYTVYSNIWFLFLVIIHLKNATFFLLYSYLMDLLHISVRFYLFVIIITVISILASYQSSHVCSTATTLTKKKLRKKYQLNFLLFISWRFQYFIIRNVEQQDIRVWWTVRNSYCLIQVPSLNFPGFA